MWDNLLKSLSAYPSGIITVIDETGYPFSLRCVPKADAKEQILRLKLPDYLNLQNGPAGMLFHYHDEQLWNLKNFVLRGTLEKSANDYIFRPSQFIDGAGTTFKHQFRVITTGRTAAKAYLAKRGLSRPAIPWEKLREIYKQAQNT